MSTATLPLRAEERAVLQLLADRTPEPLPLRPLLTAGCWQPSLRPTEITSMKASLLLAGDALQFLARTLDDGPSYAEEQLAGLADEVERGDQAALQGRIEAIVSTASNFVPDEVRGFTTGLAHLIARGWVEASADGTGAQLTDAGRQRLKALGPGAQPSDACAEEQP